MHTAPSSHSFIIGTRWIGVFGTALLLFMQQRPVTFWWVCLVVVGVSTAYSIAIQPLTRLCMRHPLVMGIDIVFGAGLVAATGGWNSPFYPVFLATFLLPAIVRGLRGGLVAGIVGSLLLASLFALRGIWSTAESPALVHRFLMLASPLGCALVFARVGSMIAAYSGQPQLRATPVSAEFPTWVGNIVRRAMPRMPQTLASLRGGRVPHYVVTQSRTESLRVALYAPLPADIPFIQRMQLLADVFEQTTHIATRCVVLGRPKPIQEIHCDSIRRIIIESLINVEQHAQATSVSILVRFDDRTVTVVIQDDGTGLPDSGIRRAGLHSLQMLMYRISEVGGRLEVFTTNGGGVAVRAAYPLSAEEVIA